ncbi:MORN repeat-containing protein [Candidatus Deianiraea vastatrix]|uniref:MORN repeat protein n=1 Tax=Candidatus Deianiraea vastatrix TaxID=2163644 RepID=A0A5B8XCX7_9RICK|nr:MORN repeat-containing protein [Candidatus Deianiraea vastatrix]QED22876.1 Putative MORN repeat protein [Candidatus Deianiraea vastatrix]
MQQNTKPFLSLDGQKTLKFTDVKIQEDGTINIVFKHDDEEKNVQFGGKLNGDIATGFFYTHKASPIPFALKVELKDGKITDINQLSEIDDNKKYTSKSAQGQSYDKTSYKKFATLAAEYQRQKNESERQNIYQQAGLPEQGGNTNTQANPVSQQRQQGQGNQQVTQSLNQQQPLPNIQQVQGSQQDLQSSNQQQVQNQQQVILQQNRNVVTIRDDNRWKVEYQGAMSEGKKIINGKGKMFWYKKENDKDVLIKTYEGNFENDTMHGKGKLYFPNGSYYDGHWVNGKQEGKGTLLYADDYSFYQGDFANGKRHGKGYYCYPNGGRYEGNFENGEPKGNGQYYVKKDGKEILVYDGEFNGDMNRHGRGIYYDQGEKRYEGDFENDTMHGQGILYYPDGGCYKGDFENGEPKGNGEYYVNGILVYSGEFNGNMNRHGYGRLYDQNSQVIYEGEWKDDEIHGQGELYDKCERLIYEGTWSNGIRSYGIIYGYKEELKQSNSNPEGQYKIYEGNFNASGEPSHGKLFNDKGECYYDGDVKVDDNGNIVMHGSGRYFEKETTYEVQCNNGKITSKELYVENEIIYTKREEINAIQEVNEEVSGSVQQSGTPEQEQGGIWGWCKKVWSGIKNFFSCCSGDEAVQVDVANEISLAQDDDLSHKSKVIDKDSHNKNPVAPVSGATPYQSPCIQKREVSQVAPVGSFVKQQEERNLGNNNIKAV